MATTTGRGRCNKCGKEKNALVRCEGCSKLFCIEDLPHHRQELSEQLSVIETNRDSFRQTLNEQTSNPNRHSFIKQIDQWESDSIRKIRQTAEECRQLARQHTARHFQQIEVDLRQLTNELKNVRQENDFDENNLRQMEQNLAKLAAQLDKPSNISIQQTSTSYISPISVVVSSRKYRYLKSSKQSIACTLESLFPYPLSANISFCQSIQLIRTSNVAVFNDGR